jgi:hypothetical protein
MRQCVCWGRCQQILWISTPSRRRGRHAEGERRGGGGVGAAALTGACVVPLVDNCGSAGLGCGGGGDDDGGGGGDDDDGALSASSASSVNTNSTEVLTIVARSDIIVTTPPADGDTRRLPVPRPRSISVCSAPCVPRGQMVSPAQHTVSYRAPRAAGLHAAPRRAVRRSIRLRSVSRAAVRYELV